MSKNQGNAMEVPGLLGAVGAGRWPAGFVAWRAAALCGLGNSPSTEAKDDPGRCAGGPASQAVRDDQMLCPC
jgi:hypothetical protein